MLLKRLKEKGNKVFLFFGIIIKLGFLCLRYIGMSFFCFLDFVISNKLVFDGWFVKVEV